MQPVNVWIGNIELHLATPDLSGLAISIGASLTAAVGVAANAEANETKPRFEIAGDVVIDHRAGLVWTRDDLPGGATSYAKFEKAVAECRVGGFDDWQAPERHELLTLVDITRHSPAIDTGAFPNCKSGYYWTRTPYAADASFVWVVPFYCGGVGVCHRVVSDAFGRAVRRVAASQ